MDVINHEFFASLAHAMSSITKISIKTFYDSPKLLEQKTVEYGNFCHLARLTNIDKRPLYRWFHDTFQRKLALPMNEQDKEIVYEETKEIMERNGSDVISKEDQKEIKAMLSQQYHVNIFTVYLNNCRRTHRRRLLKYKQISFDSMEENHDSSQTSISDVVPPPWRVNPNVAEFQSSNFSFIAFDFV